MERTCSQRRVRRRDRPKLEWHRSDSNVKTETTVKYFGVLRARRYTGVRYTGVRFPKTLRGLNYSSFRRPAGRRTIRHIARLRPTRPCEIRRNPIRIVTNVRPKWRRYAPRTGHAYRARHASQHGNMYSAITRMYTCVTYMIIGREHVLYSESGHRCARAWQIRRRLNVR